MRVARHAEARCLLVTDIDRGGAFAHLYGTWALLPEADRARARAASCSTSSAATPRLLAPAPADAAGADRRADGGGAADVAASTACPRKTACSTTAGLAGGEVQRLTVAVRRLSAHQQSRRVPAAEERAGLRLRWARSPADAGRRRLDHPAGLQEHQRRPGLAARQGPGPRRGRACGARRRGAGHLRRPADAGRGADRPARHRRQRARPGPAAAGHRVRARQDRAPSRGALRRGWTGAWAALSGVAVQGYEIHHGRPRRIRRMAAAGDMRAPVMPDGLAWQNARRQCAGALPARPVRRPGACCRRCSARGVPTLDTVFDGLADYIDRALRRRRAAGADRVAASGTQPTRLARLRRGVLGL